MDILKLGSRGPEVELLQAALNRAGLNLGEPSGIFDNTTHLALQLFQKKNGLISDGIFGKYSKEALRRYLTGYFNYTVRPNDTLFNIANEYNTTIKAIEVANPNINPYQLQIGQIITVPLSSPVVFTNISFTYDLLEFCLEGLIKRYPFLKIETIGQSVMKRNLYCISIGEGKNEVFYNASHHANEWITTPILMKFLEEYADAFSKDERIFNIIAKEIYEKSTIYLVPMINPDGVNLVTGLTKQNSPEYQRAYKMNNPQIFFPDGWKANLNGVDLNLNYPAQWQKAKEVKFSQGFTVPGPRDYVGRSPVSEPESQAVLLFTLQHFFRLTLAYHTQGEVIYWKFLDFLPPQSLEIAEIFSQVSGYLFEETPISSGYAGYKDWFIQTYNLPGYTIEAGLGINPLPISQFDKIYKDNLGILTLGALL